MKELLEPILKLVRLVFATILDPGAIMPKLRRLHGALYHVVVDTVELQREK